MGSPGDALRSLMGGDDTAQPKANQPVGAPGSALQSLLQTPEEQPQFLGKRPSSAQEFRAAQFAGGYTEPAEKSGRPISYLIQKPDESYTDFMQRAVAHGKTVSPEQIQDEANQPKKIAEAEIRGAAYGAAGMTGLIGTAEGGKIISDAVAQYGPEVVKSVTEFAKANPVAAQVMKKIIEGASWTAGGAAIWRLLGLHLSRGK